MPKVVRRNMFDDELDLYVVTTNGCITDDKLVMGRGVALDAKGLCPRLPREAAETIQGAPGFHRHSAGCFVYGFVVLYQVVCRDKVERNFGLFQVKYKFADAADTALIGYSVVVMNHVLRGDYFNSQRFKKIGMNYPGIGNGRLTKDQVVPLLESLDKRVTVYEL